MHIAQSTVALTDVELISYLKLNIFEVFFVAISIRIKSRTGRGRWRYGTLKRGREPQKVEKHWSILTVLVCTNLLFFFCEMQTASSRVK